MDVVQIQDISAEALMARLKDGATMVYPTETCYGLGCDATNASVVQKIFSIKHRQKDKPLLTLMADKEMAMRFVVWSERLNTLADRYWPGPLTVVASVLPDVGLPEGVVADDGTIAFRITDHPFAEDVCRALGSPLVSTSANISDMGSPYDIAEVRRMFEGQTDQPDIIIDAGPLPHRAPSTIVRVVGDQVEVLRQGEVIIDME